MTIKAHTYYIIFGRPPIGGGSFPSSSPLAAPQTTVHHLCNVYRCCRCYRYQYYRLDIRLHDARADGVVAVTGTDLVVVFEAEVVTHLMRQSRRRAAGHRVVVLCRNRTTYVRHDTTCYFSVRSKADMSQLTR